MGDFRGSVIMYFEVEYWAFLSKPVGPPTKIILSQHTSTKPLWPEISPCLTLPGLVFFFNIIQCRSPEIDVRYKKLYRKEVE